MTVDVLSQRHLAEATEELRLIESLAPAGSAGFGSRTTRRETAQPREGVESAEQWELPTPDQDRDKEKDDRPSKWRRPDAKGPGGRGKGRNGNGAKDKTYENSSWEQQQGHWETHPRHWEDHRAEGQLKELRQLRQSVDLLTTLVLRHDNQLTINAQDTAYMIFVRTDIPGNLAAILYEAGQAWNAIKEATPEKLSAPMRIILMQKLLSVVLQRLTQIMEPGDKQEQAKQLGWLSADGKDMHAMRWDPERKRHVLNPAIPATSVDTIKEALTEMIVLCQTPDVAAHEQAGSLVSMGSVRGLLKACQAAEEPARAEGGPDAGQEQGQQSLSMSAVLASRLSNGGNHCYSNALVKCLAFMDAQGWNEHGSFLPPGLRGILSGLLGASRPVSLWANPFWRSMFRGWQEPNRQHDVADFLQHLGQCCPELLRNIGIQWEARAETLAGFQVQEEGLSLPLGISPSAAVVNGVHEATTIQRLVNEWASQEGLHAAAVSPRALVLQIGRFKMNRNGRAVRKWGFQVVPNRVIVFHCFSGF